MDIGENLVENTNYTKYAKDGMWWNSIIRYQSRNVIYPVLEGSGFVKRWGVW